MLLALVLRASRISRSLAARRAIQEHANATNEDLHTHLRFPNGSEDVQAAVHKP